MQDLFSEETKLLQKYTSYLDTIPEGGVCQRHALEELLAGYSQILRQLRTLTKFSDKTTENLRSSRQELMRKVRHDALTGVFSRGHMSEKLQEFCDPKYRGSVFCFMMIDVDFFKKYNDIYGHPMGDTCLKDVALSLSESICGLGGFVARYGGEEFAVVIPHTTMEEARALGDKILQDVSDKRIPHAQNAVADHITISIGCVVGMLSLECQPLDFIEVADKALYHSKQNGRNQVTHVKLQEALS